MRAGNLDRIILIQRATMTIDGAGTPQATWVTFATLRAQVIQQSADEFIRNEGGATSENNIVFRTRYAVGINLDDRVSFGGATFDIKETKEIGRKRGLELRCIARVS